MITKEYLKNIAKQQTIALSISSPTKEVTRPQNVQELIPNNSTYVVIPSTPTIFIYNTDQIILGTLPLTKNMLIDLTLPFYYQGTECEQGHYFARYLMYDQRLIGIRISCATKTQVKDTQNFKKWPFKKTVNYTLSRNIIQFYKRSGFTQGTYSRSIKVGDFILSFKNIRIRLLFESELKAVQNLLNQTKYLGADIISIVADTPRQKMFENKLRSINYTSSTALENHLKQFARTSKKVVMYAGCRIAPLTQLYLCNPFIIHYKLPQVRIQPHFLNKGGSVSVLCTIKPNSIIVPGIKDKPNNLKPIPNLVIDANLRQIKSASAGKYKHIYPQSWSFYGTIPQQMQQVLKKMHLWYIYNSVNQGQPFICPLPLQSMNQFILKNFIQISAYNNKPLNNFILFYKSKIEYNIVEYQYNLGIKIYESLNNLLSEQKRQKYFIFTNDSEQMNCLQTLIKSNNNIFICQKDIFMEQQSQKNKQIETIEKRVMNFAQKIMDLELFSIKRIYQQNKASPHPLTRDQLRVSICDHLKPAIRSSYRPIPFFTFLKQLNQRQLMKIFDSVEQQIHNQQNKGMSIQVERNQNNSITVNQSQTFDSSNPKNKDFLQNLQSMKKLYGDERRSVQAQCHRCQKYHAKYLIKDCQRCHIRTCFLCFQAIKGQKANPQSIQECLTCRKLCFCPFCMKKKKKFQKQKQRIQASTTQIKNLSLIHTQKTLEQLQQIRIKQQLQRETCQICQIEGRVIMFMKISCTTCDIMKCFNCVKSQQKGDRQFIKNWQCQRCIPPQILKPVPIIAQIQQERMDQQPHFSPKQNDQSIQKKMSNTKKTSQFNRRSPLHSPSPTLNRNNSRFNDQKSQNQQQQKKNNRRRSPSQSNSPQINRNNPRLSSKIPSQKMDNLKNNKNIIRSPSRSYSPKRPQKQNKPKQQTPQKRKRIGSPSHSGSPVINRNNNRVRSPSNIQQDKKYMDKEQKKRLQSPSDSGSNKSTKNRNKNLSNSRARQTKKQAGEVENDSKPLWGNKNNYNNNNYNNNNNRQGRDNYKDRGGRTFNNQWNDRNNNNRGRGNNYGNRGGNRNNNYQNRYNNRNNDELRMDNNQKQQREVEQKILNIESQYNNQNIDY